LGTGCCGGRGGGGGGGPKMNCCGGGTGGGGTGLTSGASGRPISRISKSKGRAAGSTGGGWCDWVGKTQGSPEPAEHPATSGTSGTHGSSSTGGTHGGDGNGSSTFVNVGAHGCIRGFGGGGTKPVGPGNAGGGCGSDGSTFVDVVAGGGIGGVFGRTTFVVILFRCFFPTTAAAPGVAIASTGADGGGSAFADVCLSIEWLQMAGRQSFWVSQGYGRSIWSS